MHSDPAALAPEAGAALQGGHGAARWGALAVLCVISSLVTGGLMATLSLYAPVIEQVERWDTIKLGIAGTLMLLCMSLAGIGAGYALERVKARIVIGTGVPVSSTYVEA